LFYAPSYSYTTPCVAFFTTTGELFINGAFTYDTGTSTLNVPRIIASAGITDEGLTSTQVVVAGSSGLLTGYSTFTCNSSGDITCAGLTDSGLTATQLVFAGTGGLLTGSSGLTWSSSTLSATAIGCGVLTVANGTTGEIILNRSTTSYNNILVLETLGTPDWYIGTLGAFGATSDLSCYSTALGAMALTIASATGNVSIAGTITALGLQTTSASSCCCGNGALSSTATDGYLYIPTMSSVPTGTPTSISGYVPLVYCTADNSLFVYRSGAWGKIMI
jgi:hypothetical protein